MLSGFICECKNGERSNCFEIIREVDLKTKEVTETFFRCGECGKDYTLDEVTLYE